MNKHYLGDNLEITNGDIKPLASRMPTLNYKAYLQSP